MKKTLLMLFAAAAFVGCDQGTEMNEPAGAERDSQMQQSPGTNDTNTISDPSGAYAPSSQSDQQSTSGGAGASSDNP